MARKSSKTSGVGRIWKKTIRLTGIVLLAAYGCLFAFGVFGSDALIYQPPKPGYDTTLPGLVMIPLVGGGEIAALWLPRPRAKTALLCFHGNADDIGFSSARFRAMAERTGCPVLVIDYPGYGLSSGQPSEAAVTRAADAAFSYLTRVRGFSPDSIVVRGLSLGTGPAVSLAARRHVKGLILDAPFTSTFRTLTRIKLLPFDKYDSLSVADRVQCPVLIMHGDRDAVIPFSQGRELADAMRNAPSCRFLPLHGVGHEITKGDDATSAQRTEVAKIIAGT